MSHKYDDFYTYSKVAWAPAKKPRRWVSIEYERENYTTKFCHFLLTSIFVLCVGSLKQMGFYTTKYVNLFLNFRITQIIVELLIFLTAPCLLIAFYPSYIFYQVIVFFPSYMFYHCLWQNLTIFDHSHICPKRGVPQTPTLRIPLKLQPKPRVLGFFDLLHQHHHSQRN